MRAISGWNWEPARLGLIVGVVVAALLALLWFSNAFTQARLALSDVYLVPSLAPDTIVIVGIDDVTLSTYGRSLLEWPRGLYADFVNRIAAAEARVIAFDIIFAEPAAGDTAFLEALVAARTGESRTRIVMPSFGVQFVTMPPDQELHYETALRPTTGLIGAADHIAYVNAISDVDGMVRQQPSQVQVGETTAYSFPIAVAQAFSRIPAAALEQIVQREPGRLQPIPDRWLTVDDLGLWRQNFYGAPGESFAIYSFRDVLDGTVEASAFADKIVLLGLTSTGATDRYLVPNRAGGVMMAGVEIQAHAIASLMEGDLPTTPPPLSQIIIVVMLSLFASLIYAYLRWQWMLVAAGMLLLVWLLFAFTWYGLRLEMLNLFHSILALTIPVLATIGVQITREVNLRRRTQFVLESVVQVSEQRMELEKILPVLAEDIQQVLKAKGVAVWLWDAKWQVVSERYSTGDNLNVTALARRMANNMQPIQESQQVVMPILWQGRLLGGFAAILRGRADQVSIDLLQNLSDEAAPSLENAILHRATERQYLLLDTILRESPAGIVILNRDLGIQQANKVASSWLSAGADASGRQTLVDQLQRLGVQTETVTEIRERLQKGQRFRTQITLEHTEAPLSPRPTNQPPTPKQVFNIDAAPLPGSGEWVLALNDISALAEVNELRTWMIRMTAHDLKNPLSQITGYIGLVMDYGSSELSADDRESLQRVMNAADQMSEIISEVTSLEQLQTGLKQREAVDLCAVAQDVIGQNDLDMTRRKQQFTAEISESVPVIQGSRIQLMQAMTNLLGNAIKYTPEAGRVTLRLFVKDTMIRFEVQDTGLGIPPDKQERLFQPFYRVRTEQTARINGTGLGLSLVKSVISAHGGRVGVISAEQQGSTFWFEIPIG